jgi:hypothetical protein
MPQLQHQKIQSSRIRKEMCFSSSNKGSSRILEAFPFLFPFPLALVLLAPEKEHFIDKAPISISMEFLVNERQGCSFL